MFLSSLLFSFSLLNGPCIPVSYVTYFTVTFLPLAGERQWPNRIQCKTARDPFWRLPERVTSTQWGGIPDGTE